MRPIPFEIVESPDSGAPTRLHARRCLDANSGRIDPQPMSEATPPGNEGATDAGLLRRIAEGDVHSVAELYDRYASTLFPIALRILREPSDAEDVLHDAFVSVSERAGQYTPERRFSDRVARYAPPERQHERILTIRSHMHRQQCALLHPSSRSC